MLIFHCVCHGIPKLKWILGTHFLPLVSIQIFAQKNSSFQALATYKVSDFLGTFFFVRKQVFCFVFRENAQGWKLPGEECLEKEKKGLFSPAQTALAIKCNDKMTGPIFFHTHIRA